MLMITNSKNDMEGKSMVTLRFETKRQKDNAWFRAGLSQKLGKRHALKGAHFLDDRTISFPNATMGELVDTNVVTKNQQLQKQAQRRAGSKKKAS